MRMLLLCALLIEHYIEKLNSRINNKRIDYIKLYFFVDVKLNLKNVLLILLNLLIVLYYLSFLTYILIIFYNETSTMKRIISTIEHIVSLSKKINLCYIYQVFFKHIVSSYNCR